MPDTKPLTVPPFESSIPADLLAGLDKRDRYLYTKLDEIGQAQGWLVAQAVRHDEKLELVREQAVKTNGRLLTVESDITALKAADDATKPTIELVQTTVKVVKNRWFLIGAAMFALVAMPWLAKNAPEPGVAVKWAIGLLIGG